MLHLHGNKALFGLVSDNAVPHIIDFNVRLKYGLMERHPAWLAAIACAKQNNDVPNVRIPSLRSIGLAFSAGPVQGILMQMRFFGIPTFANSFT